MVLTISGKQIKGADAATFETLTNNQGRDKNHYYFVAHKDVTIPWKHSASACPPCYGWGNVDGELCYAGVKQPQADAASFRCFSFNIAADKNGFYIYGKPQAVIPADAQVKNITPLSDNSFSDGKYVWFVGVDATLLSGINAGKAKVEDIDGGEKVSDGVTGWQCTTTKTSDEPSCSSVSKAREGRVESAQALTRVDYHWDGDQLVGAATVAGGRQCGAGGAVGV